MANPWEDQHRTELRQKYERVLKLVWAKQPDTCPICNTNLWNVGELVDAPLRNVTVSAPQHREVYVYVPVTCLQCGYTRFFHSGILDARIAEADSQDTDRGGGGEA